MSILGARHLVSKRVWKRSRRILGRVVHVRIGNFRMSGLVMTSDQTYLYNPNITADGTYFCDCQGHESTGAICSHLMAILRKADIQGYDIDKFIKGLRGEYQEDEFMRIYETSLEGYNKLFGGLQSGRHISALFSPPEVGKSFISATFAVDMALMHDLNALIIDTEGGFAPEWISMIAKHRGEEVDVKFIDFKVRDKVATRGDIEMHKPEFDYKKLKFEEPDKPTVYIHDTRHIVKVMPFFGRPLMFRIKSAVIEPQEAGGTVSIWESPIGKIVEECNIGYVANDSLSSPIESFFTGGQINYRTRAKATQAWLGRAQELIDEYKLVFMNTAHATIAHNIPASAGRAARTSVVGGKAVLHNNKYIAYLEKYKATKIAKKAKLNWRNFRKLHIYRHMTKTPWSEEAVLVTTDHGVEDFDTTPYLKKEE